MSPEPIKSLAVKPEQVVETARTWINTPFHHQARLKGVGCDCVGLILGVAWELGLTEFDSKHYGRIPDGQLLVELLHEHLTPLTEPELGSIALFRIRRHPQHLGLITGTEPLAVIHAYQGIGKVAEHFLDNFWAERVIGYFRLPGVKI